MRAYFDRTSEYFAWIRTGFILVSWFLFLHLATAIPAGLVLTAAAHSKELETEQEMRIGDVTRGALLFRTEQQGIFLPAPILKTDVDMNVTGLIARATVRQQFTNPGVEWAEGIYVFPLPDNAAVDHLRMRIGERIIEGMIKERAEAKKTYEKAKEEGQRASLLEQERPNIFTVSVANIAPHDQITVEIEYQQVIHYDHGQLRLRFPMVVGPRYIPGTTQQIDGEVKDSYGHGWAKDTDRVPDASRITPPVQHPSKGPINPVSMKIDLTPGFPLARLESAYHEIGVVSKQEGSHSITLQEGTVPADRDFELMWQPTVGKAPTAALFTEQKDGETFALLMIMPPEPSVLQQRNLPRDVIFVIDTSGSMYGHSIEQAKAALILALARLSSTDTFNVIQFNNVTHALFAGSTPFTKANYEMAIRYVSGLKAEGGTEMLPALKRALNGAENVNRLRQVIYLTDGAVGNEDELFNMIRQRLGDSRLFTIGIGSAPNSHFMRKAAEFGRGTFTHIGSTTEVRDKMDALFQKLEHPMLTEIKLELPSSTQAEIFPERIPDLYLGEPLMVAVKTSRLPDRVILSGQFGKRAWETGVFLNNAENRESLSVYWARQKIASLMDQRQHGVQSEPLRQAVIEVALKHHLVSQYTSLVAVDITPLRPEDKELHTQALKTNLPHGWDYTAVFGQPQTATGGRQRLLLGLLALVMTGGIYWLRGQRHEA